MKVTHNSLLVSTTPQCMHGKVLESLLLGFLAHAHELQDMQDYHVWIFQKIGVYCIP